MDSLQEALEQLGVYRGAILAPEDLMELRRGAECSAPDRAGWTFVVPVSETIGMALRQDAKSGLFVGLLRTPSGLALLCVTLQVGRAQVRIVVDAADSRAQELLRWSAEHGEIQLICSTRGATQARLIAYPVEMAHLESLIDHTHSVRVLPPLHHALELAAAVHELGAVEYIKSCEEGVDVEEVLVCTITPDAGEIQAMRRAAGAVTKH